MGLAATACGRWEAADRHLWLAAERDEAIGSAPLLARTHHADMLLRRDDDGDRDEALRLLAAAAKPRSRLGPRWRALHGRRRLLLHHVYRLDPSRLDPTLHPRPLVSSRD